MDGELVERAVGWRRRIHADPEFGFDTRRTAAFIAETLRSFGIEAAEGVGGTGVVGTLRRGGSNRAIGLRADMDALMIAEASDVPHASRNPGVMHACGHDGHSAMLLAAAGALVRDGGFDGTVRFVFQPAEEHGQGARAMLDDGLFDRFPVDEVYGLHNMPGMSAGAFAIRPGPIMGAEDNFRIVMTGVGGHAAKPHVLADPLVAACSLVVALQTIVSRAVDPAQVAVVSVTEFVTDGGVNVVPSRVEVSGDTRSFLPEVSAQIEAAMRRIAAGVAEANGVGADVTYERVFVPTINAAEQTDAWLHAARAVTAPERIDPSCAPLTTSEDFAWMLQRKPGAFAFIGNGEGSWPLHHARYDFNDEILPLGAEMFCALVRQRLPEMLP